MLPDKISPQELLKHLSPQQRRDFEDILKDPQKAEGLLNTVDNDDDVQEQTFWWQKATEMQENEDDHGKERSPRPGLSAPVPLPSDKLLPVRSQDRLDLAFNLLAIM